MRRCWISVAAWLAVGLGSWQATAAPAEVPSAGGPAKRPTATPSSEPTPDVEPPRALDVPRVPYPEGATGRAAVVLVIVVDVDGSVRAAEVESGDEPFATAAREASTGWRFEPATRDGAPVSARIRFQVEFTAEQEDPFEEGAPSTAAVQASRGRGPAQRAAAERPVTEATDTERGGAESAVASPSDQDETDLPSAKGPLAGPRPIEVTVQGARIEPPPSVASFRRAEVRQLPGAFGDPFRALEVMPGVTPMVSALPFFYVRGAPPGNVGYFLDGVRVPYLFHAAAGPSVINPALVERVDLYAGGYPAQFGRYAGGIVSAETTPPNPDWHGEAVLRLIDAGALLEGGFADGRVTALLGGRYSYVAGLLSLISPEITLGYRDYQARASVELSSRERLTLLSFGSYDYLSFTDTVAGTDQEVETVLFGSEFYRVDGRYDARLVGGGTIRAAVTWGFDQTRVLGTRNTENMLVGSRVQLSRPLSDAVTLRGGFDLQIDSYRADERQWADPDDPATEQFNQLFPPRSDTGVGAWTDLVLELSPAFEIVPGIRLDTYASEGGNAVAVDPRLSIVARPHESVRILHAVGIASQPPSFVVPVPGLALATLEGGLQRSVQASSGVEVELPLRIMASITGFAAVHMNMTDSIGSRQRVIEGELIPRSLGSSKGMEIYVRRALTERLGGFVAYTLSRTTRSVGNEHFLATFDRPHVLHAAIGYDLGRGWRSGLRFSVYSGTPNAPDETVVGSESSEQDRDPPYYRIDFRLEKRWSLVDTAWMSFVLEMLNATLTKETLGGSEFGPLLLPSIGLEGGF